MDFNTDSVFPKHQQQFDIALNMETNEQIANQANTIKIIYDLIKPGGWMTLFVPSIGYIQRCAPSHHVIYLMFVHEFWNIFGGILIYSNIPRQGILAIYKVLENPRMRIGPVVYVLNGLLIEFFSPSTGLPIASPCFAPVQSNAKHHNTGRYK